MVLMTKPQPHDIVVFQTCMSCMNTGVVRAVLDNGDYVVQPNVVTVSPISIDRIVRPAVREDEKLYSVYEDRN